MKPTKQEHIDKERVVDGSKAAQTIEKHRGPFVDSAVFLIKLALGSGIIYWLVSSGRFDVAYYKGLLSYSNFGFVIAAMLTQAVSLTLLLSRWWFLLKAQNIHASYSSCLTISFKGAFSGIFLPGTLGLDGLRFLYLQKTHKAGSAISIASITLDRALGFMGLLILAVAVSVVFVLRYDMEASRGILALMVVSLIVTILLLAVACGYIPMVGARFFRKFNWMAKFIDALATYRNSHRELAIIVIMSVLGHALVIVAACFGLMAMGLDFSILAIATVTPILIVVRFIPLTPLGLGVSDAAGEELYNMLGIAGGAENQMLLRATWIVVLLLCGLIFFRKKRVD